MITENLTRRDLLRLSVAGVSAVSLSGWFKVLASRAAGTLGKHKSCILLWMDGGPSHKDTFDMKPGTKDAGEFKPIATNVTGMQISEHFPKMATADGSGGFVARNEYQRRGAWPGQVLSPHRLQRRPRRIDVSESRLARRRRDR